MADRFTPAHDGAAGKGGGAGGTGRAGSPPGRHAIRRHPVARRIARSARALAPDAGTLLVACSGGADSTALLAALWSTGFDLVCAHVRHDLRPDQETSHDARVVRNACESLGIEMLCEHVHIRRGNAEGEARRLRYQALERMARARRCACIVTAHHADDQLESLVMALLRGAGPEGLRGIAPRRTLDGGTTLIRPALDATRADLEDLCAQAALEWTDDATNRDTTRLRAALRHDVLGRLLALRPEAPRRAARTAALMRDVVALVDERVDEVFGDRTRWQRDDLRGRSPLVLGAGLRRAAKRCTGGTGADALTGALLDPAVEAITDSSTDPRRFDWPGGLVLVVTAHEVHLHMPNRRGV